MSTLYGVQMCHDRACPRAGRHAPHDNYNRMSLMDRVAQLRAEASRIKHDTQDLLEWGRTQIAEEFR